MRFVLPTTYARTRIYRPHREDIPREKLIHADLTDVSVRAHDGLQLNGWYALSRTPCDTPHPLIVYFPGASGHRGYRVGAIEMLARIGCDVLLFDYRGYGDNPGQPTERHQARDARDAWKFAIDRLHVPAERIVLYGESIGGAVSTRLAAELCRAGTVPGGLILQATFASMLDVVSQFFPRWLATVFLIDRFPSIRRIRHVRCPILAIHGDEDALIPIEMGRRLFDAAPPLSAEGRRKQFLELAGIDHNDILDEAGDVVEATLVRFLKQAVPTRQVEPAVPASPPANLVQPLP